MALSSSLPLEVQSSVPLVPTSASSSAPTSASPSAPTSACPSAPTSACPYAPTSACPSAPTSAGPSAPTSESPATTPASAEVTPVPTQKVTSDAASKSMQGCSEEKVSNATGFVAVAPVRPGPSFTYNFCGVSQQSSSSVNHHLYSPALTVTAPSVPALPPPIHPFSYNISPISGGFASDRNLQTSKDASVGIVQTPGLPSASNAYQSALSSISSSSASVASCTANDPVSQTAELPANACPPVPPRLHISSGILPPIRLSAPISHADSASAPSAVNAPPLATSTASNPVIQQQAYHAYPSLPSLAPPQGLWVPPQQLGVMPRPPFFPFPTVFTGPLPFPAHGFHHTPVSYPGTQSGAVNSIGTACANPSSAASSHQLADASVFQMEVLPPGIDSNVHSNEVGSAKSFTPFAPLEAWTAHKTATGTVYYYNALTGLSTYEKPAGFICETEKVHLQPVPASMENVAGTDWVSITTNDGKKYYYNNKTKLSSWQVPSELEEMRKNRLAENGCPLILSAPAVSTGGRDATTLRGSSLFTSSALDLIKKKLQDTGTPVASSSGPIPHGIAVTESIASKTVEAAAKGLPSEQIKDKLKDYNGDGNDSESSLDSGDEDKAPTKEECIINFKEMLKERGIAPFSKWDKELSKIVFDPRFKAIPSHSVRRSLFEHYVKTRAEEERREKRAAQKANLEGFKNLLDEASEFIDHTTDYHSFRKKWGDDPRFEALDRKDREQLLNERILVLKRSVQEKFQAEFEVAAASFKALLRDRGDLTVHSHWSRVKDELRSDPRYRSVRRGDREVLFHEYLFELKAAEAENERRAKAKKEEQDKLVERQRELRKRKEREEQEMGRVLHKVRRKEAISSFQALLVETIKDPKATWTESKPKLDKDPQGRTANPDLNSSDSEKLFRDHIEMLTERCAREFYALLAEVLTAPVIAQKTEDGKTVLDSWSTAKRLLKSDFRYSKMPRKQRENLWHKYVLSLQKQGGHEKLDGADARNPIASAPCSSSSRSRTHLRA